MENVEHQTLPPDQQQRETTPAAPTPVPSNRSSFLVPGIVLVLLFALAVAYGIHSRAQHEDSVKASTEAAAIPTVNTTYPSGGSVAQDIILPGNVQAFIETPIYARTNGYLKKWYFDIGAHVRQGQLLATIETPEVDQQLQQSRAELERIQANSNLAGVTSERWDALLAKHAVSQQEADQNKSNFIASQAAVDASRANVRRLEQLQSYERIVAPFDGIITARNTDIGDLIDAGTSNPRELFHLSTSGKLRVFAAVPEIYSSQIHDGDTATLSQDSNPSQVITGKIVRNSNAINTTTRTLNVEVDVDNMGANLLPGSYVFVHFKLPAGSHVVTIPSNTLLFRSEGLRVGVVHSNNKVELRPVTIGHDYGSTVEITSGIDAHDQIILDPADSLTTGTAVHPNLLAEKGAH
ncbi:efflux RND transporter periplasmic adaptor subunit [Granulicella sp. dw_53]|uniref:efflux RND transporter periplasmic adaptor subunit n=1 Tax=Granulicella sp. dw_53 TaxID=2719792 RepID=UPI002101DF20|nr:efflux RND transporter periplasmic adaptor subunit [Granulicella sp. dw_53]